MKEYYNFYYEDNFGLRHLFGSGFYKQPQRSKYFKTLENLFNAGEIKGFLYKRINN